MHLIKNDRTKVSEKLIDKSGEILDSVSINLPKKLYIARLKRYERVILNFICRVSK